jgi:hypothetical protein
MLAVPIKSKGELDVNRKPIFLLGLAMSLFMMGAGARAQAPDTDAPPPPPGGPEFRALGGPGGGFFFMGGEFSFESRLKPITGAPFSAQATTETTQVLADGNQIKHTETAQVYRDSSGRTRHDATLAHIGPWSAAKSPRQIVNITDPVAGQSYLLDVTDKTVVKRPEHIAKGDGPSVRHVSPAGDGAGDGVDSKIQRATESLGTQTMAGVPVQGTRTTETIPAGTIGNQNPIVVVSERWVSTDLQTVVYSKHTDPRFGTTIYQLANVSRQEPDESLFQVPPDYTVKEGPMGRMRQRQ